MTIIDSIIAFVISVIASTVGAICGVGGGIVIKPVFDFFGLADVTVASFLSSSAVLAMSCYSVIRSFKSEIKIDLKISTPLAAGAAAGGILGSLLFKLVRSLFENPNTVGLTQAICLGLITTLTLAYTVFKDRMPSLKVKGALPCLSIGLLLGVTSSFLGIGGGPINLVVLYFFFGMDTKTAAANSLYIILFSQTANLTTTLIGGAPEVKWHALLFMISGGILGAVIGKRINRKLESKSVDRLFIAFMSLVIFISIYNALKFVL